VWLFPQNTTGKRSVDWDRYFICGASLPFCHLGPSLKAWATFLWGSEGRVHCEVDGVWTCWSGPLWKFSSSSESLEENEMLHAWPLDVGRSDCRCNKPRSPSKSSSCSELLSLEPLLRNSLCPKPVQISALGAGTQLSCAHSSKTAYWGTKIQCGLL
jgi:hypothetical protein